MKCVVHIGTEKTGTSLLQDWFYLHREGFKENGIHLTTNFGMPNNRHISAYFRSELDDFTRAQGLKTLAQKAEFFASFDTKFEKEVMSAAASPYFLITSEHFHSRLTEPEDIEALKAFLDRHFESTTVVCYFREQSDMALSYYSTTLKGGGVMPLNAFMNAVSPDWYYYNHLQIADRWSNVFGIENCRFRLYDREQFPDGDIRRDFLRAMDIDPDVFEGMFGRQSSNESVSGLQAAMFLKINQVLPYWDDRLGGLNPVNLQLKKRLMGKKRLRVGTLSFDKQSEVAARFDQTNAAFLNKYFGAGAAFPQAVRSDDAPGVLQEADVKATVEDILDVLGEQYAELESLKADAAARRSNLAEWIDKCDYKIHKLISQIPVLPKSLRRRFKGAAARRKRAVYSD